MAAGQRAARRAAGRRAARRAAERRALPDYGRPDDGRPDEESGSDGSHCISDSDEFSDESSYKPDTSNENIDGDVDDASDASDLSSLSERTPEIERFMESLGDLAGHNDPDKGTHERLDKREEYESEITRSQAKDAYQRQKKMPGGVKGIGGFPDNSVDGLVFVVDNEGQHTLVGTFTQIGNNYQRESQDSLLHLLTIGGHWNKIPRFFLSKQNWNNHLIAAW